MRSLRRHAGITRRTFLKGSAAAAVAGAAIGVLPGCTNPEQHVVPEPLVVDEGRAINVLEEYEETELEFVERATFELPVGCVPRESTGTWSAVTQAGASVNPVVKGCALSLADGTLSEVVARPSGDAHSTVIYNVACSDEVYAWVELDVLTHDWTLYAARFHEGVLDGKPTTLWQGDADFDPPGFVCVGDTVLWQIMPSLSGSKTREHSFCYLWKLGGENAASVVESPGRFATTPSISGNSVILSPRVRADEDVYYGVTAYALDDDLATIEDQLVLPRTIKPFYATRIGERFAISVEANYKSGGMFGNMGTYLGTNDGPFVRLAREPHANVAGQDDVFVVKSRASYFVVNVRHATYSILMAANRSMDYGEYPLRVGQGSDFATFSLVKDEDTGYPASVIVRTFTL